MTFPGDSRMARQRQITTLKVYNASVEEVVEGSEYKIGFLAGSGLELELVVVLSPSFPVSGVPVVVVKPPVVHPWVLHHSGQVTGAPGLNSFTPHSDLGMVVNAIKRELEKNENLALAQAAQEPPSDQVDGGGGGTSIPSSAAVSGGEFLRNRLSAMERDELLEIMDKDEAMLKFIKELQYPPLESMKDNIKSMEENIVSLAQSNVELQGEIESARDGLLCKVETFHKEKEELGQALVRSKHLKARVEGGVLADKLVRLSVANEELSDNIAEKFLTKQMDVDSFVKEYMSLRQQCHLQKLKADKIKQV